MILDFVTGQPKEVVYVAITLITVIVVYLFINIVVRGLLLKKARTKKMKHNVIVFSSLLSYMFILLAIIFLFISLTGGITGIGITAGLLSAALGWALQRPITGVAGWLMVIITRPFGIGDRVIIGDVKGDVSNITITHIHLNEFGGTVGGDEVSGREIIIPNAFLFEKNVINYTSDNEYILDEVIFTITYSSNLEQAKMIAIKSAKKIIEDIKDKVPSKPFVRSSFQASGVDIKVRYYTIASKRQETNSKITEEIFNQVMKEKKVYFAYPHTEIYFNKRNNRNIKN